ncbi:UNVERIFIED_CONTAM: WAT1-related protein [Sesamum radiatum]|uniref:WAT1-related protein n=1 Tax=Sesamum radiatum TaxID=300843 RepID=A0AAW2MXF2_SESRA
MGMENAVPYVLMVIVQFAQVGLMIAGKAAMSNGMTTFTFIFYSNGLGSLVLLPFSIFIYRFLVQVIGYTGIMFASASLSTSILNLIPGFTFVLAVIFRLEKFNCRSKTTLAKSIGTVVSIIGAVIATLYQGPSILGPSSHSNATFHAITSSPAWILGGFLLVIDSLVSSFFIIAQALVLKKCPVELVLMFFYSCFIAIASASVSLAVEKDLSAWSLRPKMRLIPVIYSAFFGNAFQVSILMWCVRKRGPLFVSVFHPLGVIIANAMGIVLLGEPLYLGSVLGSIVVVVGFYSVMWGKAREAKTVEGGRTKVLESNDKTTPLLQNNTEDGVVNA